MNNLWLIGKKEIGWFILVSVFFILTLKIGIWYGSKKVSLETKTSIVKEQIENIMLKDKVAALEVNSEIQEQKIVALIDQMILVDKCMKRKWKGCYN